MKARLTSARLKAVLNLEATRQLRRHGYSNRMADEAKRDTWMWATARGGAVARRARVVESHGIVWSRQGWAELSPFELPLAGPGEVTVETEVSAVSPGTERAQYLKLPNARVAAPFRPGYSLAGIVRAVGRGVSGIREGDLVAVRNAPHASVVTVASDRVYPVPAGVAPLRASLVTLGIICGQGVRHAAIAPGEPVCVLGAGLIGLLAQRMATAADAGPVTMVARSHRREDIARAGGAAGFEVAGADEAPLAALASPVVIEATGDAAAIRTAVVVAAPGARIVLLGSPRGITEGFPLGEIQRKRLTLIGAHVETLTYEQEQTGEDTKRREANSFLAAIADGRLNVHDLLPEGVDPREAARFYRRLGADEVFGARFEWTRLPAEMRMRSARLLRAPNVPGRGVDSERRPIPTASGHNGASPMTAPDPFADAQGDLAIAIIGCGDIAIHNAAAISEAPNTRLVACYDPVPGLADDLAGRHRAGVARTQEELFERDDVDVVLLCVPHHLHVPLALEAIEHGKNVVVEKPPANNLASALAVVEAAERAGVVLSFCFPHRYDPAAATARRLIDAGALGTFGGCVSRLLQDRSPSYWLGGFSGRAHSDWRGSRERAGGGTLIMNVCHYVDLVRWLAGVEVERVTALAGAVDHAGEVEDTISVSVQFANGAIGSFFGSTAVRGTLSSELRLWGADGHVVVEADPRIYTLAPLAGVRSSRWQAFPTEAGASMRAVYFSRLATRLARALAPEVSAADGLAVQSFIEAAYRSVEEARPVEIRALLEGVPA